MAGVCGWIVADFYHAVVTMSLETITLCYAHDVRRCSASGTTVASPVLFSHLAGGASDPTRSVFVLREGAVDGEDGVELVAVGGQWRDVAIDKDEFGRFGFHLATWTVSDVFAPTAPRRLRQYRLPLKPFQSAGGIMVSHVSEGSTAWAAGLRPFQVAISCNGIDIRRMSAAQVLEVVKGVESVTLKVHPLANITPN
mmetsp:Transcript_41481/g.89907  ORF Transcript_41481/g.89907 Transcript_41481/m.89907 type:complete len:197 (+) Transcript_41481:631-1221(+)